MVYIAQHTISHDGKEYLPGAVVDDIKGKALERLIGLGAVKPGTVEEAAEEEPKESKKKK